MCLPTVKVDRFYQIWRPLLHFANEELQVVPNLSGKGPKDSIDVNLAMKVRDAFWKHEAILETFIKKNPAQLSPDDLMIVETWKYHRQGQFIIFKVLKKHAIFISQDKRADVFAVKGLCSPFEEMLGPFIPALVETVLLPFGNEIITDGIFQSYNLMFGSGIRGELKEIYDDAKERDAIISTLLPNQQIQTRESLVEKAETINKKVLDAFSKYQYKSGRSPKTVERDVLTLTNFMNFLLSRQPEPASLREFQTEAIERFLLSAPEKGRKPVSLGIKRFVLFMQDTGRLDWVEAENMLALIKQRQGI
jgi:hypothetical protein